jgi:hypothetical protein
MGMQYDVKASAPRTSDGQMQDAAAANNLERTRIKTIYGISGTTAGSVKFYNGTSASDPLIITVNTPAAVNSGTFWLPLPGEGLLAENGVYLDITDAASVMIIYG